jgi:hypothetical protein
MADARVAGVARLIDGLRRDRRQHPLRGRGECSARVREVAGAIADMIESGRPADAVPLARRAVERVTAALLYMDDSSGIIGDDLRALTALYARACRAAPPDPKRLAAWLVTSEDGSRVDVLFVVWVGLGVLVGGLRVGLGAWLGEQPGFGLDEDAAAGQSLEPGADVLGVPGRDRQV